MTLVGRILSAVGLGNNSPAQLVAPANAIPDLIRQRPFGGTAFPTNYGNLTAETPEVRQRYREMLRCGWVKVALFAKLWDVASDTLGMEPENADDERDKMISEAAAANVNNVSGGVLALVEAFLCGALIDGYGLCHKLWWDCDRGKWAGKRMLYELRPKDSDYFWLVFDDYRRIVGVQERYPAENDRGLHPVEDFVIIRHLSIFDSPFGMSDFRAADQAYCCLDAARKLRMIYLDKYTGPFVEGKYTDERIKDSLLAELREMRSGGVVVYPDGTELKITQMATGTDDAFHQAEADLKEEIVVSIAFAFLQHMAGQVAGGPGKTAEHQATARLPKWYLTRLVCQAIDSQVTPQFVDWNFSGTPAYPKSKLEGSDQDAIRADLEIAAMKLDMGGEVSKAELDKRSGWGPAKNDTDRLVKTPGLDPFGALTDPTKVDMGGTPTNGKPVNGQPAKVPAGANQ